MQYFIEAVDQSGQAEMLEFLKQHENYTLFLLGNFENYGGKISTSPYSGNFKIIRSAGKIVGVFCLTKKGSLLIKTTVKEPIFDCLLTSCQEESIPLTGLVGEWSFCHAFWQFLKHKKIIREETFAAKEILYNINTSCLIGSPLHNVRLLNEYDYAQWKPLRLDYIQEEGFQNDLSEDQLFEVFLDKTTRKISWGCFHDQSLISIADLNAKALDLGQVGGVYTVPHRRQQGYSRSVMQQLFFDAKKLHAIRKLIIFTNENNSPAQKLYISLGAEQVGVFSLFFGKP